MFFSFLNLQEEAPEEKKQVEPNASNMEESSTPSKPISAMTINSTVSEEHQVANEGLHNDIDDVNSIGACSKDNSTVQSKDRIENMNGGTSRSLQPSSYGRYIGR